ncbi:MAG: cobalamin biosynthesis protein [Gammaproteobacteria bacterium]|nr:cobalamin biosynthesis protein [Gammaproteobacteria bacterium]MBU2057337.1 cobalamin biosynthesis protein [Gammaproteobacteria bacterium]MBU2174939.1 cobalamin biosynthesis protein [Gammaproteobacteria bacterium]MBU2245544.1 cobalamin biosynthesis protein [Gammaproteobacteria bacterium]MBU2346505.1 cobalamin biosynthesis protein [Gammaproteobacteria bacterium]
MPYWLTDLSAYPLILLCIWLPGSLVLLPQDYQPLTFFRIFAKQLAAKVHPDPNRASSQQLISGSLALAVVILPTLALLAPLYWLSDWPLVLDGLLLYFCLDFVYYRKQSHKIALAVSQQQNSRAKDLLQPLVLRQTQSLSSTGLCKATIEMLWLRTAKQWIGVSFWFLIGGGLAAVAYRLLLLCNQQWNDKHSNFRYFGRPASLLTQWASFPASLITALLLAMLTDVTGAVRQWRQAAKLKLCLPHLLILGALASALRVNLAGPVIYQHQKNQRQRLGPTPLPQVNDMLGSLKLNRQFQLYSALLVFIFSLLQSLWLIY